MVLATAERFRGRVDVLVLAQVSMARLAKQIEVRLGVPVLESLSTSLRYAGELL
jgi:Asp/Glu/hydantoin racemase